MRIKETIDVKPLLAHLGIPRIWGCVRVLAGCVLENTRLHVGAVGSHRGQCCLPQEANESVESERPYP